MSKEMTKKHQEGRTELGLVQQQERLQDAKPGQFEVNFNTPSAWVKVQIRSLGRVDLRQTLILHWTCVSVVGDRPASTLATPFPELAQAILLCQLSLLLGEGGCLLPIDTRVT